MNDLLLSAVVVLFVLVVILFAMLMWLVDMHHKRQVGDKQIQEALDRVNRKN